MTLRRQQPSFRMASRNIPCNRCGHRLEFAPENKVLKCPQCLSPNRIAEVTPDERRQATAELDLEEALASGYRKVPRQMLRVVTCSSCGAQTHWPAHLAANRCPFCMTPMIVVEPIDQETLLPSAMLPFRLTAKQARDALATWLDGVWWISRSYGRAVGDAKLHGIYMPFWTFDVPYFVRYKGARGEKGDFRQPGKDEDGFVWTDVSGELEGFVDDIIVPANPSFFSLLDDSGPWPLDELEPYSDEYVSGFISLFGRIDLSKGVAALTRAREEFDREVGMQIEAEIGGERQSYILLGPPRFGEMTFKYIALPVWLASCEYEGEVKYLLVNGYTGNVQGELPWAKAKANAAWGLALAAFWIVVIGHFLFFLLVPEEYQSLIVFIWLALSGVGFGLYELFKAEEVPRLKFIKKKWRSSERGGQA